MRLKGNITHGKWFTMSYDEINSKISFLVNKNSSWKYWTALSVSALLLIEGIIAAYFSITHGLTIWGINNYVPWGVAIASFVFWIGIGHAGTLISAILFLFRQKWRIAIHRSAEAMTIIAVICAAILPVLHTGRPWFALYWLFPYPSRMGMWVNFNSPLIWDIFAIITYFILSVCFWYLGLIPDFAVLKKYVRFKFTKKMFDFLSLGWKGTERQWKAYKSVYILMAGIATALVISVHSIVSTDFSVALVHGWHSTIFPPYFVAGAILSGCAFVGLILLITRSVLHLEQIITERHFNKLNKIVLATSMMIGYSYLTEWFFAWYSGNSGELSLLWEHLGGFYNPLFYLMILFNVILPQLYWFERLRTSGAAVFIISVCVTLGMWLERFVIVVTPLYRSALSGNWTVYLPKLADYGIFIGTVGLFLTLYLIFIRVFPVISVYELKTLVREDED